MKPAQALRALLKRHHLPDELALVARGTSHSFLLQGLGLGLGYAVHVGLARWMGAAEYGIYTYVLAWTALLSIPAGLGLPVLVVRLVPEYSVTQAWGLLRGRLRWGWRWIAVLGFGLALAGMTLVVVFETEVTEAYTRALLLGLWLVPLQACMRYAAGIYQSVHQLGRAYVLPVLRHVLVLALAFLYVIAAQELTSVQGLGITVGAVLVVLLAQGPALRRAVPAPVRQAQARYEVSGWLRVSVPLLLISGFWLLLNETSVLLLGTLLGPEQAGVYKAASKTASLVGFVLAAVGAATLPVVATLYARGELGRLQHILSLVAHAIFWPSLVTVLFLVLAAKPVLGLFGPGFASGRWVLIILAGGQLVHAGAGAVAGLLSVTGHQKKGMTTLGWNILLNVMLNLAGIVTLGLVGAALATALSITVTNVSLCVIARREAKVDPSFVFALWGKPGSALD